MREEEIVLGQEPEFSGEEAADSQAHPGREVLSWMIDEYERHQRGPIWYAAAGSLALAAVIYAIVTQNFLFAVIIIMFGVILGLASLREPRRIEFVVTDLGIGVDGRFFPYKDFKNFWILYEPPEVKNVYLEFRLAVNPHIIVPLHEQNPLEVRDALRRFLDEDAARNEEPFADLLARLLKL